MIPKTLSMAFVAPALAAGALVISAGPAFAHETFVAVLSGANEVPAGDPGTTGVATVEVEDATGEVCTTVTSNAESATAMHIHKGAAGINGPVVV
ncbi:MAG TPA: CHRD domain-containing protein, partial [Dermatophilaceae bacterium]|nr:CHRD domain-containing protein [Dermatophilaceae bacterium]